ncbi:MAG: hypothetical protein ACNI27_06690 [Desulfovibrio sp.]
MPSKYVRKRLIIDKNFQYDLIKKLCLLIVIFVVFALIILSVVYHIFGSVAVSGPDPFYFVSDSTLQKVSDSPTAFDLMWPVLTLCIVIVGLITIIYGVYLSHNMAGPLYRLRLELKKMTEGDYSGKMTLRENDAFQSLVHDVNNLKKALQAKDTQ